MLRQETWRTRCRSRVSLSPNTVVYRPRQYATLPKLQHVFITPLDQVDAQPPVRRVRIDFLDRQNLKLETAFPLKKRLQRIAVKDNIATTIDEGLTTCASKILQNHRSPFQAYVVERLCHANARIIGKTNLDEFGMGSHSLNSQYGGVQSFGNSVGGSSGGSALAVASGIAAAGLGTDTGGSVRLPAAYTGTVGFKPSYGVISRWGVIPYANSLDTVGIIAGTTEDLKYVFERAEGHDSRDPTSLADTTRLRIERERRFCNGKENPHNSDIDFSSTKIGVPIEYNISELDPAVRDAWTRALKMLRKAGATIVPVSLPNTRHALSAYYVLAPAEAASNLAKYDGVRYGYREQALRDGADGDVLYSKTRGDGFGKEVRRRILLGSYTLSSEAIDNYFIKAQKVRRLVQRDFDCVFALHNPLRPTEQFDLGDMQESILLENKLGPPQVDYIISPTAPTPPPRVKNILKQTPVDTYMNDIFTVPASLAGIPAISIPFPLRSKYHVPDRCNHAGIQIMGQFYDDKRLLSMASKFEDLIKQNHIIARKKVLLNVKKYVKPVNRKGEAPMGTIQDVEKAKVKCLSEEGVRGIQDDMEPDRRRIESIIRKFFIDSGGNPTKETICWIQRANVRKYVSEKGGYSSEYVVRKFLSTKGDNNEEKIRWIQQEEEQEIQRRIKEGVPKITKMPTYSPTEHRWLTHKDIEEQLEEAFAGWEALDATKKSKLTEADPSKPGCNAS